MFLLRGIFVCLSVFVLVYAGLSAVVATAWNAAPRRRDALLRSPHPQRLFAMRFAPAVSAVAAVALFAVPSFLRFEPRTSSEGIGEFPLLLGFVFLLLVSIGAWRVASALRRTSKVVERWIINGSEEHDMGVPVISATGNVPAVALTGICRSKLMISRTAAEHLDQHELARAVEHEMAHLRARDNLKKLLLQAIAFPGMRRLERAWADAVELSADAAAVHSETEALELASALIKISRMCATSELPVLASGLVDGHSSLLEIRVRRLMNWRENHTVSNPALRSLGATAVVVATFILSNYASVLRAAHTLTEALVR